MKKVIIRCKIITPLFMGGAEKKQTELRVSEFKGMMRFWWRAIKAEDDIEKLKKEENRIFGGTGEGEGKSKINIRITYDPLEFEKHKAYNLREDYKLSWYFDKNKKEKSLKGKDAGTGYMLYSTVLPGKERGFIKDGFNFDVILYSYDEDILKEAIASFWLSVYLGGFGTRSRRGGGNLSITDIEGEKAGLDFICHGKNGEEVGKWIKENFEKCVKIVHKNKRVNNFTFSYSNLSFSRFLISRKGYNSWIDVLNDIGKKFMGFRKKEKILKRTAFGLPLKCGEETIKGKKKGKKGEINFERRGSPFIIKVIKAGDKFYWLALRLFGEFLEEGSVVKFKNLTQKVDFELIDKFWNELKIEAQEFILNCPKILDDIVKKIKDALNPCKIIFFGSRARGDAHRNSDIDIAVDCEGNIENIEFFYPCDLVNYRKASQSLREKIEREGVTLYERKN